MSSRSDAPIWERGWGGHEEAQRRRLSQLPLIEKIKWLEEAHELVKQLSPREARHRSDNPQNQRPMTR